MNRIVFATELLKLAKELVSVDKLSPKAIESGAQILTITNLGQDHVGDFKDAESLSRSWHQCQMAHEAEGIDIGEEYRDWLKQLKRNDKFSVSQVLKVAPWLASI